MLFGYLTLFTALALSVSAATYSILGLTAIFAAAFWPIVILGSSLEFGMIISTLWLHKYWHRAEIQYKIYLSVAVAILMVLTSMGVFGFLSKAHSDQSLVGGDVLAKISVYDEQIKTEKENIDANRRALKQMDEAVDQTMARSSTETGADKSVAIRRSQQKERQRLLSEIEQAQKKVSGLNEKRAPIAAEVRKVEADVGPIKYIAALIYGDTLDAGLLEKAVRWVIIMIVVVFDPLALTLLLAATKTFEWERPDIKVAQPKDNRKENKKLREWIGKAKKRVRFWHSKPTDLTVPNEEPAVDSKISIDDVNKKIADLIQLKDFTNIVPEVVDVATEDMVQDTSINSITSADENATDDSIVVKEEPGYYIGLDNLVPTGPRPDIDPYGDEENQKRMLEWKGSHPTETYKKYLALQDADEIESLPWDPPGYPAINFDNDPLQKTAHDAWQSANPDADTKQIYHNWSTGLTPILPWLKNTHVYGLPLSDKEKKSLVTYTPSLASSELVPDNQPMTIGEMRGFGNTFPTSAVKGDMFLRVDQLPSQLFKYNGQQWIQINKDATDNYAYDQAYIDHLIEKISSGEYEIDLLSDVEREQIAHRLRQNNLRA